MTGDQRLQVQVAIKLASVSAFGMLGIHDGTRALLEADTYWSELSPRQQDYYMDQADTLIQMIRKGTGS